MLRPSAWFFAFFILQTTPCFAADEFPLKVEGKHAAAIFDYLMAGDLSIVQGPADKIHATDLSCHKMLGCQSTYQCSFSDQNDDDAAKWLFNDDAANLMRTLGELGVPKVKTNPSVEYGMYLDGVSCARKSGQTDCTLWFP